MYITFGKSTADKSSNYIISALTDICHCATHSQADMTRWYHTCYDSFICAMTYSYMPQHHSFTCGHDSLISTYIHTHMCHASFIRVMTQSYVPGRHSFTCGHDLLISTYIHTHLRHDSYLYDIPHSHVRHHSFACGHDSLIFTYSHTHLRHDSFICAMTDSYVPWRQRFTCVLTR